MVAERGGKVKGKRAPGSQDENVWYPEASSKPGWAVHTPPGLGCFLPSRHAPLRLHIGLY